MSTPAPTTDDDDLLVDVPDIGAISLGALRLHCRALVHSHAVGRPGHITHARARHLAESPAAVADLIALGLWHPTSRGYRLTDTGLVEGLLAPDTQFQARVLQCRWRGHHRADLPDQPWVYCADCAIPLTRPDGGLVADLPHL